MTDISPSKGISSIVCPPWWEGGGAGIWMSLWNEQKRKSFTQFTANHYSPSQETNPLETQQVAGSNGLSIHKNKKKSKREERKYIFHKCCPIPDYEPIKVSP